MSDFVVKALDASTWEAFADLVECNGGIFGGCWCIGMHPEGDQAFESVEAKRQLKHQKVVEGSAHAALVFEDDRCVGWAQFGSPDEIPRIKNRKAYDKEQTEAPDWRIGCCYVGKGHRRKGVSTAALAGALGLIAQMGGGTVEGYPEPAGDVPAGFLYHGVLSTFEANGFDRVRKIGKHRWVVGTTVEPL